MAQPAGGLVKWHATWAGWAALTLLLEAIGLRKGGPMTRTVRRFIVASAGGTVALVAFAGWLVAHFAWMESGFGVPDVVGIVAGGLIGLAGWAHRMGDEKMLSAWRMFRSWAWPILVDVGRALIMYGPAAFDAARAEVAALEDVDLPGTEKRDRVVTHVREATGYTEAQLPTWLLHTIVQVALLTVRGVES